MYVITLMNKLLSFLIFFWSSLIFCQQQLIFKAKTNSEQQTIDSLYSSKVKINIGDIEIQTKKMENKLIESGFLNAKIRPSKSNDSLFMYEIILGKRQDYIYISIDETLQKELSLKAIEKIKLSVVSNFMLNQQKKYDALGFNFHKLSLKNFKFEEDNFKADLYCQKDKQRLLNHVVWQGMDKFPRNHQKFIEKKYTKKPFSESLISQIENEIKTFSFCQLNKSPEVLFSQDSTKIYLTIEKKKNNQFDGYAGFSTDENNGFRINGHLDLSLNNLLGNGEQINIFWRNNGEDQTQFQAKLALPYLFGSRFTTQFELQLLQQDSTFQNTQTKFHLGYHLKKSQRIFIGLENLSSNYISNNQSSFLKDFNSNFVLFTYTNFPVIFNAFDRNENILLFSEFGYGNRKEQSFELTQYRLKAFVEKNIKINEKQNFWIRNENFYLLSDNYLANELFRFGGHQSFRGYLENSLQANQYHSLLSEYQYFFNPSFYLHSITDYGFYNDKTTNFSSQLLSAGLGFGFASKNGILKFNYVSPLVGQDGFKFSNSIVHIQFKSVF